MSSGDPAAEGNAIARASLDESRRQYNEQQAEKKRKEEAAKANALSLKNSGAAAYGNNDFASTNITGGQAPSYSLLSMAGSAPVFTDMLSGAGVTDKLGG